MAGRRAHLGARQADRLEVIGQPGRRALNVRPVIGLGADAGDRQQLLEFREVLLPVGARILQGVA
jgi:hypothetical protein